VIHRAEASMAAKQSPHGNESGLRLSPAMAQYFAAWRALLLA
jgi:hypothetical protein